jgi:hypothetical protein
MRPAILWTDEQIEAVRQMRAEGYSNAEISDRLRVSMARLGRLIQQRSDIPKREMVGTIAPARRAPVAPPARIPRGVSTLPPLPSLMAGGRDD